MMKKRHINLFWGSPAPTLPNVDFRILRFIFNKPLNLYHHRCRPKSPGARENPARPRRQEALGEMVKVSPSPSQTHRTANRPGPPRPQFPNTHLHNNKATEPKSADTDSTYVTTTSSCRRACTYRILLARPTWDRHIYPLGPEMGPHVYTHPLSSSSSVQSPDLGGLTNPSRRPRARRKPDDQYPPPLVQEG